MLKFARKRIKIEGTIKDSRFGLFVYNTAKSLRISGFVKDEAGGAVIEAEGKNINKFLKKILEAPTPAVVVERISEEIIPVIGDTIFRITGNDFLKDIFIPDNPPDSAICSNCRKELFDIQNRRYGYAFINCPDCGMKFSMKEVLPASRINIASTSSTACQHCRTEFNDPLNRRFHQHGISCPECGPKLKLFKRSAGDDNSPELILQQHKSVQDKVVELFLEGKAIVLRNRGGFSLICSAAFPELVHSIQQWRAHKWDECYLLCYNLENCRKYFRLSGEEARLLNENGRPAVLLHKNCLKDDIFLYLYHYCDSVSVSLACSGLEYLLTKEISPLIVFSGRNIGEASIAEEAEAVKVFCDQADYYLFSDMQFSSAAKPTIKYYQDSELFTHRMSFGSAPMLLELPLHSEKNVLALGGDINNAFCLLRGAYAVISQHNGDLKNLSSLTSYEHLINKYMELYNFSPDLIAADLQPDYTIKLWAEKQRKPIKYIQHHQAHAAACAVENNLNTKIVTIVLDGGGLGGDGALWGGEFFTGSLITGYRRAGYIDYYRMLLNNADHPRVPAGEICLLKSMLGKSWKEELPSKIIREWDHQEINLIEDLLEANINCVATSSAGKFLLAIKSLFHFYLGEERWNSTSYSFEDLFDISDSFQEKYILSQAEFNYSIEEGRMSVLHLNNLLRGLLSDLRNGVSGEEVCIKFFHSFAWAAAEMAMKIGKRENLSSVCLSGGLFYNTLLYRLIKHILTEQGFLVYGHHKLTFGDGNLCLGQAALAGI